MGRGIAAASAVAGHEVLLYDVIPGAAQTALDEIEQGLARWASKGRITEAEAVLARGRLRAAGALTELSLCNIVVEAVVESLEAKQQVFAVLEDNVGTDAILATNTSSLSVAAIARGTAHPERFLGMHFFNPVSAMDLVEIIPGPATGSAILAGAQAFVRSLGKTDVVVRDSPGFLVNLAGRALATEALHIVQDGAASFRQVDTVARRNLGFPLGPFELMDLTGMDVNYPVTANLFEHNFADDRLRSTWYHRWLFEAGMLGRKTGQGYYEYPERKTGPSAQDVPEPSGTVVPAVAVAGEFAKLLRGWLSEREVPVTNSVADAELCLVAAEGLDASRTAAVLGTDPRRTVALDLLDPEGPITVLMVPPGVSSEAVGALAEHLRRHQDVEVIADTPGFIGQRLLAAVINLACDIAQRKIAAPADIDTAVRLGLGYPRGPLAWADHVGPKRIVRILDGMFEATRDPRYRCSPWLRRRAAAGLSCLEPDYEPGTPLSRL
ncbi:3-hydroxyacyl-CoA dehydrogenase [Arthrobacter gandavensis]|nr:3-hydroxyacyl-CoA dehydrogenase [Arthrobacter gandavensis]